MGLLTVMGIIFCTYVRHSTRNMKRFSVLNDKVHFKKNYPLAILGWLRFKTGFRNDSNEL